MTPEPTKAVYGRGDPRGRPIGINLRKAEVKKGESSGKMLE
jgi:hypothetical protein